MNLWPSAVSQKSTAEEYYRITQFLSHVVSELEERFANNPSHSLTIGLLPSECTKLHNDVLVPEDLAKAVDIFKDDAVMFNMDVMGAEMEGVLVCNCS